MNNTNNKHANVRVIDETTPLLVVAGPMFIELFLNILLNNIDTIMLSRYSENSVGAVGNANQVMMLVIIMLNIIATATSVIVAQYLGAGEHKKMNMIYSLAFGVNLVFGVVLSAGLILGRDFLTNMLNVSAEMKADSMLYIEIVGGAIFLQACYNVMLQILRCNGYPKVGMYVSIIINLINIGGNYLFLYGPLKFLNLGVAGVAISTVFARLVAVTIAVTYFYIKKVGRFSLKELSPFPGYMLMDMVKIGLPSAGENFCYSLYQLVLLSFINRLGNDSVNARSYCNSLISFAMCFSNSCAMATQIIVGRLIGAKKEEEAGKRVFATLKISLPITVILASVNCFLSPYSLRLFTDNSNIIRLGFYIMLVDIFLEMGRCLNMTLVSSLKASGDYLFPFLIGLVTMWLLGAGLGYTFGMALGIGVAGIYMGTASDECIRGLIVAARWKSGAWKGKSIVRKSA